MAFPVWVIWPDAVSPLDRLLSAVEQLGGHLDMSGMSRAHDEAADILAHEPPWPPALVLLPFDARRRRAGCERDGFDVLEMLNARRPWARDTPALLLHAAADEPRVLARLVALESRGTAANVLSVDERDLAHPSLLQLLGSHLKRVWERALLGSPPLAHQVA